MSLTDARKMWKLAAERGTEGIHSHEVRRLGVSGNPSQRAKDIADHVPFWTKREQRNGRPGSRYYVDGTQPKDAEAVRPNRVVEQVAQILEPRGVARHDQQISTPRAATRNARMPGVLPDEEGVAAEHAEGPGGESGVPAAVQALHWRRDYTDPNGRWEREAA